MTSELNQNTTILPLNSIPISSTVDALKQKNISEEQFNLCMHEKNKLLLEVMEQRKTIDQLTSQKNTLEECLRSLNDEFDKLSVDYGNVLTKNKKIEKNINVMRNKVLAGTKMIDSLLQTNNELKERLMVLEQQYKLSTDELRNTNKKATSLMKSLDNCESSNKKLQSDLSVKEEKYNIVKVMNERLEAKSHQIIRRMESVIAIEQKMKEYSHDRTNLENKINILQQKINDLTNEKDMMIKKNQLLCKDKNALEKEINKIKESFSIITKKIKGSNKIVNYNTIDDKTKIMKGFEYRSVSAKVKN